MSDEIIWADPPESKRERNDVRKDAMRSNPGRWLLYGSYETRSAAYSQSSYLQKRGFEACVRNGFDCYARLPEATK